MTIITRGWFLSWFSRETMESCWGRVRICGRRGVSVVDIVVGGGDDCSGGQVVVGVV